MHHREGMDLGDMEAYIYEDSLLVVFYYKFLSNNEVLPRIEVEDRWFFHKSTYFYPEFSHN